MSGETIDIDEFDDADEGEFEGRNDTERIVRFLDDNDDRAWTAAAIADALDLQPNSVSAILSRLKKRDLVRHKRPYWAITDDEERLRSAYEFHRYQRDADGKYGEESIEDFETEDMEEIGE